MENKLIGCVQHDCAECVKRIKRESMPKELVWVVEIKNDDDGKYEPCAAAQLTRADARREMTYYWRYNNPSDEFRVAKYVRA